MPPKSDPGESPGLDSIEQTAPTASSIPPEPDSKTQAEERDIDKRKKSAKIADRRQDTRERKKYAPRVFYLSCIWLAAILTIILLDGFGRCGFHFSDLVVLALIGSTTVNVLGIFYVVANYLFPNTRR